MTFHHIMQDLRAGKYQPVYFLMGEEPYFIDLISDYVTENILKEEEKAFNLQILYGNDVNINTVITAARRFPVMSKYQVIIVKEAQQIGKLDGLEHYLSQAVPSTILVFCHKYRKLDKRSKISKIIASQCVLFESDRMNEDKIPAWIGSILGERGYQIDPKAAWLLVEFLGNDLGKLSNELDKLLLLLPEDIKKITPAHIEQNIGISKDFNHFELNKALISRDILKSYRILGYFKKNPRNNPAVLTISTLYYFFSKLLLYHGLADKTRENVAKQLGIHPYFVREYQKASSVFSFVRTREVISLLREYDLKSKGVDSLTPDGELMRELIFKILQ